MAPGTSPSTKDPLEKLEHNVKDIVKDFVRTTGRNPLTNNSVYYLLHIFCKQPSNAKFKKNLWERALGWIEEAQIELTNEDLSVHKKCYDSIHRSLNSSVNYSHLKTCYGIIIKHIKEKRKEDENFKIEDVLELYEWIQRLPYNHFGPLITELWEQLHSKESDEQVCNQNLKSPTATFADLKACIGKKTTKCFVCLSSGDIPKPYKDFKQHLTLVHSIFIYSCDVEGCQVKRKSIKLLEIHKKKHHAGKNNAEDGNRLHKKVKPLKAKRTKTTHSPETFSTTHTSNSVQEETEKINHRSNKQRLRMMKQLTYETKKSEPTASSSYSAYKGKRSIKISTISCALSSSSTSKSRSSRTIASLQKELLKCQLELQNAQVINHNYEQTIQQLVEFINSKLGKSKLSIGYNELEGYPKLIFPYVEHLETEEEDDDGDDDDDNDDDVDDDDNQMSQDEEDMTEEEDQMSIDEDAEDENDKENKDQIHMGQDEGQPEENNNNYPTHTLVCVDQHVEEIVCNEDGSVQKDGNGNFSMITGDGN